MSYTGIQTSINRPTLQQWADADRDPSQAPAPVQIDATGFGDATTLNISAAGKSAVHDVITDVVAGAFSNLQSRYAAIITQYRSAFGATAGATGDAADHLTSDMVALGLITVQTAEALLGDLQAHPIADPAAADAALAQKLASATLAAQQGHVGNKSATVEQDTANAEDWATRTNLYDALGRLAIRYQKQDDDVQRQTVYDAGNAQSWATRESSYDPNTGLTLETLTNDDGSWTEIETDPNAYPGPTQTRRDFDANGTKRFERSVSTYLENDVEVEYSEESTFDAAGLQTRWYRTEPSGRISENLWDRANLEEWKQISRTFDEQGRPESEFRLYDEGGFGSFEFDRESVNPWASKETRFRPHSQQVTTNFDDLSKLIEEFDTGNMASWAKTTRLLDAAGRLMSQSVTQDNGTSTVTSYDVQNVKDWTSSVKTFDAQGRAVQENAVLDNGGTRVLDYDTAGTQPWRAIGTDHNAGGQKTADITVNEDQSSLRIEYDVTGLESWSTIRIERDAAETQTLKTQFNRDGTRIETAAGTGGWTDVRQYNAAGDLASETATNLDGRTSETQYDLAGAEGWTKVRIERNAAGTQVLKTVTNDDGTALEIHDDPSGQSGWVESRRTFDAAGQKLTERNLRQDGSVSLATYDRANGAAWASRTEQFDAQGRKTGENYVNDDQSTTEVAFDAAGTQAWSKIRTERDAAGVRLAEYITNDDLTSIETYDDASAQAGWVQSRRTFDAAGQKLTERNLRQDGTASRVIWDRGNAAAWTTLTEQFDAQGRKLSENYANDDQSTSEVVFDAAGTQAWSKIRTDRDAAGVRVAEYVTNDDLTSVETYDDASAQFGWVQSRRTFNAGGQKVTERNLYADGGYTEAQLDPAAQNAWASKLKTFNAAGVLLQEVVTNHDLTRVTTEYDAAGANPWASYTQSYDSAGRKVGQRTVNDDQSVIEIAFDAAGTQAWASKRTDFNAAGVKVSEVVSNDDQSREETYFDATGQSGWVQSRRTFDALGRKTVQLDQGLNGVSSKIEYDVSNDFSWATRTKTFDAAGNVTRAQTLNDDQTAVVERFDVANAESWSKNTLTFDAAGRIVIDETLNDNTTRTYTAYDAANRLSSSSTQTSYDAAGVMSSQATLYDDGSRLEITQSSGAAGGWVSVRNRFNAQGALVSQASENVDGRTRSVFYDRAGVQDWFSKTTILNALRQTLEETTVGHDGVTVAQQFDVGNVAIWSAKAQRYDAAGRLISQIVQADAGSSTVTNYDAANAYAWASRRQEFNDFGVATAVVTTNDDQSTEDTRYSANGAVSLRTTVNASGQSQVYTPDANGSWTTMTYDPLVQQGWLSKSERFDNSGRKIEETMARPNGTSTRVVYDTAGISSWTTNTQQFNASGSKMSERWDNDDGTAAVREYDYSGSQSWASVQNVYAADGETISTVYTYDDQHTETFVSTPSVGAGGPGGHNPNLMAAATSFLTNLYQTILGRSADSAGLQLQRDAFEVYVYANGMPAAQVEFTSRFANSSEALARNSVDPSAFLSGLYDNILGRPSDPAGLGIQVAAFNGYVATFGVAAAEVEFASRFAQSAEGQAHSGETMSIVNGTYNSTPFFQSLYTSILGRPADSAGLQVQVNAFNSALRAGWSLSYAQDEFRNRFLAVAAQEANASGPGTVAQFDVTTFFANLYTNVLGRSGTSGEISGQVAEFNAKLGQGMSLADTSDFFRTRFNALYATEHPVPASAEPTTPPPYVVINGVRDYFSAQYDPTDFILDLYRSALGREATSPELAAQFNAFKAAVNTGRASDDVKEDFTRGVYNSDEAKLRLPPGATTTVATLGYNVLTYSGPLSYANMQASSDPLIQAFGYAMFDDHLNAPPAAYSLFDDQTPVNVFDRLQAAGVDDRSAMLFVTSLTEAAIYNALVPDPVVQNISRDFGDDFSGFFSPPIENDSAFWGGIPPRDSYYQLVGQWFEQVANDGTKQVPVPEILIGYIGESSGGDAGIKTPEALVESSGSLLGKLWASPNTALGILAGLVDIAIGAIMGNNVNIEFKNNGIVFTGGAIDEGEIVFGNAIIYGGDFNPDNWPATYATRDMEPSTKRVKVNVGLHAEKHTLQYESWGVFFLPAYFAAQMVASIFTGDVNAFEGAADTYSAAHGGSRPSMPLGLISQRVGAHP